MLVLFSRSLLLAALLCMARDSIAQSLVLSETKKVEPLVSVKGDLHALRERAERLQARASARAAEDVSASTEVSPSGEQRLPPVVVEGRSESPGKPPLTMSQSVSDGVARAFIPAESSGTRVKKLQENGLMPPSSARSVCANLQNIQCWVRQGGLHGF